MTRGDGSRRTDAPDPRVPGLLRRFSAAADPHIWGVPFLHHHRGGGDFHVVLGVGVHGDETGPLPAAVRLVEALAAGRRGFGGTLTVVIGNPDAVRAGVRCVESDLNRIFVDAPPDDREGWRARTLMPVLQRADLFLDLHQTGAPSAEPFYTLPWRRRDERWARALQGAGVWITRQAGETFSPGTCCADEYVRARGVPGLTLELGRKGLTPDADRRAGAVIDRLLALAEDPDGIAAAAAAAPPLRYLQTVHREPFVEAAQRLREGLGNVFPVAAGALLSAPDSPEIRAPRDGFVMFPKYPRRDREGRALGPVKGELFHLAAELPAHPSEVWGEA